ncbi:hypothetical protein CR513_21809, partial [Mucuna pruriens]
MFEKFILLHVPCQMNERVNLLAKLASTQRGGLNRTVIQEALEQPTVQESAILSSEWQPSWCDPIINYLCIDNVYTKEASLFLCYSAWASEKQKKPYKKSMRGHTRGRALDSKIARAGFYWPTLKRDSLVFVKKYDKCQRYDDRHQAPLEQLHFVTSP